MNGAKLYLMLGYPGAGKTTTAEMIAKLTGATKLSSDEIRMELFPKPTFTQSEHDKLYQEIDKRTEQLLRQGKDVIYDANLNRYEHREQKYEICQRTKAKPVLVWLQTPKDLAKERAVHDSRAHLVPPDEAPSAMFDRIADIIEPPKPEEAPITIDGTHVTPTIVKEKLGL